MGSSTTYVTLATQLNRAFDKPIAAGGTGAPLGEPIKRGTEFTADDVTQAEIDRWLTLKPAVIISKKELEDNAKTAASALSEIEDLRQQLAAKDAELAAARQFSQVPEGIPEPGPNKSKAEWLAFATDKAKRDNGGEIPADVLTFLGDEGTTRDALREQFGTKTV